MVKVGMVVPLELEKHPIQISLGMKTLPIHIFEVLKLCQFIYIIQLLVGDSYIRLKFK